MSASNISSINALEIGRSYKAVLDGEGRPALEPVVTPGRPRALAEGQIIAARALRDLGWPVTRVAATLEVSHRAVSTALAGRNS